MVNLTPIGDCYSGLRAQPGSWYRKLALATPRALLKFDRSSSLRQAVDQLGLTPDIRPRNFTMHNANVRVFLGRNETLSVGLWLKSPVEEETLFQKGLAAFRSMARGVHRELFFLRTGVTVTPEINDLAPDLYAALLAKIRDGFGETTFENIVSISFSESPFDVITTEVAGKILKCSLPLLRTYPSWSYIEEIEEKV